MKTRRYKAFLGIDVSKAKLDFCLLPKDDLRPLLKGVVPNSLPGCHSLLTQLQAHVKNLRHLHCTFEATGVYTRLLAQFFHDHKIPYSMVNPAQIKFFGQSHHARTKTDPADARRIAQFGQERQPALSVPLSVGERRLQALVHEMEALIDARTACKNRLHACDISEVSSCLQEQCRQLDQHIAQLEKLAMELVNSQASLQNSHRLLCTIKGIAQRSALYVQAELLGKKFSSARQLAAYAGLTPSEHKSGSSVNGKTRLCKTGNARLRTALYLPAQSARIHCHTIKAWADQKAANGLAPKAVIGAVMRKLAHIIFGVLKYQLPFDPLKAASPQLLP